MSVSPNGRNAEIMKATVVTRSIALNGLETGVCLEEAFWGRLEEIAHERVVTLNPVGDDDRCRALATQPAQRHSGLRAATLQWETWRNLQQIARKSSGHAGEPMQALSLNFLGTRDETSPLAAADAHHRLCRRSGAW
jgi:predicted DNA-binding ribbon-helix-helix protein